MKNDKVSVGIVSDGTFLLDGGALGRGHGVQDYSVTFRSGSPLKSKENRVNKGRFLSDMSKGGDIEKARYWKCNHKRNTFQ